MLNFLDRIQLQFAPGDGGGASPASAGAGGDAGAASAAADAGDTVTDVEEVPEAADAAASAADDGDDDDSEDDYADLDQTNPRIKSLVNRTRKSARQLKRQREIVDGMRGPGGRFLNPSELRQQAEYWKRVEERAARDPKFRATLMAEDEDEPAARTSKPAAKAGDADPFEQFDPDHPATPLLKQLFKNNQDLQKRVDDLDRGFKQTETRQTQAQERAEVTAWTEAIDSAAKTLPKTVKLPNGSPVNLRDVFSDAVKGAYIAARQQGKRLDVQKVIKHYMVQAGVNTTTATRVAADAQRAAEHNKSLPRAAAVVPGGRPSPAKTTKETVAEVSRRIMGRRFA